jgi:cytochrome c2
VSALAAGDPIAGKKSRCAIPWKLVAGNWMIYAGISDPATRANVIAYLATLKSK